MSESPVQGCRCAHKVKFTKRIEAVALSTLEVDLANPDTVASAAWKIGNQLSDVLINIAGTCHLRMSGTLDALPT